MSAGSNYESDERNVPSINDAPAGWTDADWHADAIGDSRTSHSLVGRKYVIACAWCSCVFIADTKTKALARFRRHEHEMLTQGDGA